MGEGADEVSDEPIGALPAAPVPRPSESGWQINWMGFVPLAIVAVLAFVGFRVIGLGDDDADAAAVASGTTEATSTTARPRPTTTTVAVTTTSVAAVPTPAPTTDATGPSVRAWGEVKPCRFGDTCLAVSFEIDGFPEPLPTSFFCIYPNSTREFSFVDRGKVDACLTGDEGDTVYIEVDGIRSAPVSATDLTP